MTSTVAGSLQDALPIFRHHSNLPSFPLLPMTLREKIERLVSLIEDIKKETYIGSIYVTVKNAEDIPDGFAFDGISSDGEDDTYRAKRVTLALPREPSARFFVPLKDKEAAKEALAKAGLTTLSE